MFLFAFKVLKLFSHTDFFLSPMSVLNENCYKQSAADI